MRKHTIVTEKALAAFIAVLLFISLVPLLVLSFYTYPAMDDYIFGALTATAAENGFFAVVRSAISTMVEYYDTWQGTFTAIPLFCLQPGIWGTGYYAATTWIMLAAVCGSTIRICSVLLRRLFKASKSSLLVVVGCILILVLQFFPSIYEALYWYNGSVYYLCFQALMLLWLSEVILFLRDGKRIRILLATLYSFLISGGNYVTVLLTIEINIIILFLAFRMQKIKAGFLFLPFLILCTGFYFNASAPGNTVRSKMQLSFSNVINSILSSIGSAGESISEYISVYILLFCLVLIPVFIRIIRYTDFDFPLPIVVFAVSFLFYASSFTPTAFAFGFAEGPHRLRNMRY